MSLKLHTTNINATNKGATPIGKSYLGNTPVLGGFNENTIIINTKQRGHSVLLLGQAQYNPQSYNAGGYTVITYMGNLENNHNSYFIIYDHANGLLSDTFELVNPVTADYHAASNMVILPGGKLLVYTETEHNVKSIIRRSVNTVSSMNITNFVETYSLLGVSTYFTMQLIGTRVYGFYRGQGGHHNYIRYSDDNGNTWNPSVKVSEVDIGSFSAYPRQLFSTTRLAYCINTWEDPGVSPDYDEGYYYFSLDGITFSNVDGTFTKNVVTSGFITHAELLANCLIDTPMFIDSGCLNTNNIPFIHSGEKIYYWNGSAWVFITLASVNYINFRGSGRSVIINRGLDTFDLYLFADRVTDSGTEFLKVSTTDAFATYTFITVSRKTLANPVLAHNYENTGQGLMIMRKTQVLGTGPLVDPIGGYANLEILLDAL